MARKRTAQASNKKRGKKGGRVPYGYKRVVQVSFIVDEAQSMIVQRIFQRKQQRASLSTIAAELNADNVPTPQGGMQWHPSTVRVILNNANVYKGGTQEDNLEHWPRILDK